MNVIEITKKTRNNVRILYQVTDIEPTNIEDIDSLIEDCVNSDPWGKFYGYSYEWKILFVFHHETQIETQN